MRALIVEDGRESYVLAAVRSLAAGGWTVGLAGPVHSRSAGSRWVARTHLVPPAQAGLDAFAVAVQQAVADGGYDVVFGGDDVEVLALSAVRDRIRATVPYVEHAALVRAIDKLELVRAAEAVGLAAPRTVAASATAAPGLPLPALVKARLHWWPGAETDQGRIGVSVCRTEAEVVRAVTEIEAAGTTAVLQELVDGDLMAVTALCDRDGRVLAESHQVASRVSPQLHTSTRAETVPVDPELSAAVHRLLAELRWFGIANLQMLRPPGGRPHLIDLNGRFYGSLALAVAAGLDLPVLGARLAVGEQPVPRPPLRARPGMRYQALEEDLRRARVERRHGLLRDVAGTLAFAVGATHSTLNPHDPRPAVARVRQLTAAHLRRATPLVPEPPE